MEMTVRHLIIAFLLFVSPAVAQEPPAPPMNANDRVACDLGRLIWQNSMQSDQVSALNKQLAAARAEIKRLTEKTESKPADPKPDQDKLQ